MTDGSKADQALASYMLAKLSSIPFETAATLAAKSNVERADSRALSADRSDTGVSKT